MNKVTYKLCGVCGKEAPEGNDTMLIDISIPEIFNKKLIQSYHKKCLVEDFHITLDVAEIKSYYKEKKNE